MKTLSMTLFIITGFFTATSSLASVSIVAFGDAGTGTPDQDLVAKDMIASCEKTGCRYGLLTGDILYPRGIENFYQGKSDYKRGTPNFAKATEIFVNRYKALGIPIYLSYGNHDVGNESINIFKDLLKNTEEINTRTLALMDNAVAYTNHADNPRVKDGLGRDARLWMFPGPFYQIDEMGNVSLFSLDTNSFPHNPLDAHQQLNKKMPKNFGQRDWLNNALSTAKGWKIVFGHQPIYTKGGHGWLNTGTLKEFRASIIDSLCDNRVDFYLAGHDHHLEVDKHVCKNGHVITAIVTGAAAKQDRIYKRAFSLFGKDNNLLWANGRDYTGNKDVFTSEDYVLGFTLLDIIDENTATLTMKLSKGAGNGRTDGCFKIVRGSAPTRITCTH